MKNRWVRMSAMVLAMVIFLSGISGGLRVNAKGLRDLFSRAGGQSTASNLPEAKEKFLEQWQKVLEANEAVYSNIFHVLDNTEDFIRDNSWDSLLKARAAASATVTALLNLEIPELELTQREIAALTEAGIEMNAVQREFEDLEAHFSDKLYTANLLCYTLEDDVFMKAGVEDGIPAMVDFYREYLTLEYRYLYQFTNYLLLQAEQPEYWQSWKKNLPCLADCADRWYDSTEAVEAATGALFDEMESYQTRMNSFLGISEYTLDIVQEALETEDFTILKREIHTIKGVPGYFPVPNWLPDVQRLYLATDPTTEEMHLVEAGEKIDRIDCSFLDCGKIERGKVEEYERQLKLWEIDTNSGWNENKDTWQLIARSGKSTMLIEWTKNETTIYLMDSVGCLIPELYLQAMIID